MYGARITCIAAPHRNASAARNTAWRASRGEFIAIFWTRMTGCCRRRSARNSIFVRNRRLAWRMGDAMAIYEQGARGEPIRAGAATSADNPLAALMDGNFFPVHAALTRRSAIERLPYLYHEEIDLVGDWDLSAPARGRDALRVYGRHVGRVPLVRRDVDEDHRVGEGRDRRSIRLLGAPSTFRAPAPFPRRCARRRSGGCCCWRCASDWRKTPGSSRV